MDLSAKQYYSRVSGLLNAGLIKRHKGKYSLTLIGKVVYDTHMTIGKALTYYWKLKAIESVEMSSDVRLPKEELTQLIDALIDNHIIKDILIKKPLLYTFEDHQRHQHQQRKEAAYRELMLSYFLRYSELLYGFGPACEECWQRDKELAYEGTTQAYENKNISMDLYWVWTRSQLCDHRA